MPLAGITSRVALLQQQPKQQQQQLRQQFELQQQCQLQLEQQRQPVDRDQQLEFQRPFDELQLQRLIVEAPSRSDSTANEFLSLRHSSVKPS
jgi:isochorismate synthase EntC